jgi:hypothetical protein
MWPDPIFRGGCAREAGGLPPLHPPFTSTNTPAPPVGPSSGGVSSRPSVPAGCRSGCMILVHWARIGMRDKSEKISPADPARRLVIEWTAQLPASRRRTTTR